MFLLMLCWKKKWKASLMINMCVSKNMPSARWNCGQRRSQCVDVRPPGSGKTLLARTLPTILPQLTMEESLEVSKLYSVAGLLTADRPLDYAAVSHSASFCFRASFGGGRIPRPGEISLRIAACFFWMNFRNFPERCWKICVSPWKTVSSPFPARKAHCPFLRGLF